MIGEPWTEDALARLSARNGDSAAFRIRALDRQEGQLVAETSRQRGKYRARRSLTLTVGRTCWISLASETDIKRHAVNPPGGNRRRGVSERLGCHGWTDFSARRTSNDFLRN